MNPPQRFGKALDAWEEFAILTDIEIEVRDSGRELLDWLEKAPAGIGEGRSLKRPRRVRCTQCRGVYSVRSPDPECLQPTNHSHPVDDGICEGVDMDGVLVSGI